MAQLFAVAVASNADNVAKALRIFGRDQLPFATAVALTRTAKDASNEVRRKMPSHFKIRSQRVVKGVQFEAARKTDWPHPTAKVGTLDEFMVLQVLGGEKKPQKGARTIAVPTRLIHRTASGAIPKGLKPRPLRDKKTVFVPEDHRSIRQRVEDRSGNLANLGTATMYTLVGQAKIPKRWPLPAEVESKAGSVYAEHFERELAAAIKSTRAQAGSFSSEQGRAIYLKARRQFGRIPS